VSTTRFGRTMQRGRRTGSGPKWNGHSVPWGFDPARNGLTMRQPDQDYTLGYHDPHAR
jgi:hypothetical protein